MGRPGVVPVFVGNISFDTTEEMIRDIFCEVGPVIAVRCALLPLSRPVSHVRQAGDRQGHG